MLGNYRENLHLALFIFWGEGQGATGGWRAGRKGKGTDEKRGNGRKMGREPEGGYGE